MLSCMCTLYGYSRYFCNVLQISFKIFSTIKPKGNLTLAQALDGQEKTNLKSKIKGNFFPNFLITPKYPHSNPTPSSPFLNPI